MPSSRVSGLEARVFGALDKGLLPQFSSGSYFVGDYDWKNIEPNIRRPDLIYCEEDKNAVIIRPYDIKTYVTGSVKPGQISPLTVLSLYNNAHFREALMDHLSDNKLTGKRLIFREGAFLIKNIPSDKVKYSGKMARYEAEVPRHEFIDVQKRVQRLTQRIGYYPYSVFMKVGKDTTTLVNVQSYAHDFDTTAFHVDTDVKSYIVYENQEGPLIRKKVVQRAYKLPESLFKK